MPSKPSKSAKKREHLALQALGEALIELPEEQLRNMPLDENLFDAVLAAASMKSRGALRRQRQLVGKLMRNADADAVRAALDAVTADSRVSKAVFKQSEQWRDRLVGGDRNALQEFLDTHPSAEAELEPVLDELGRCEHRDSRRTLGRKLFRIIHSTLSANVHNTTA